VFPKPEPIPVPETLTNTAAQETGITDAMQSRPETQT